MTEGNDAIDSIVEGLASSCGWTHRPACITVRYPLVVMVPLPRANMADEPYGEGEWKPPTEAELKIMEAKRERSNKISQLMGGYLLKGYKMLATNCPSCEAILLRSKEGEDYCVACSELSTDVSKDDPAVSDLAAQRQAAEGNLRTNRTEEVEPSDRLFTRQTRLAASYGQVQALSEARSSEAPSQSQAEAWSPITMAADSQISHQSAPKPTHTEQTVTDSIDTVQQKLQWATQQLRDCENPEACIQWCKVVQQCADSMLSLYTLKSKVQSS